MMIWAWNQIFVRCNILINRFKYFAWQVEVTCKLFQALLQCLYNSGLWQSFSEETMHRFYSCCNEFVKRFFGFAKYSSFTTALLHTGLLSCTTVIHNFKFMFRIMILTSTNVIVTTVECVRVFFCPSLFLFFCVSVLGFYGPCFWFNEWLNNS